MFERTHKRILVVRPDRVGDVVLSTPVYHSLKQLFPGSFVGALVSSYTSPLLQSNPNIDVLLHDDARSGKPQEFWSQVAKIRSYEFDTALILMPTARIAYMLFLAGIPYRVGVGHILYEVLTLMRGVSRKKYVPLRHESDYMLDLVRKLAPAGKRLNDLIWTKPEIFISDSERVNAVGYLEAKGLDPNRPVVGIHPGSGHSAPNWNVDRYIQLAAQLADHDVQVLVTGSPEEKELERKFKEPAANRAITSFGELTLRELASVISTIGVFISSSTGPMHIAAALGVPTVSMFCPLTACSPDLWGPKGNKSTVILPPQDFCQTKCPGDPHVCTFGTGEDGTTVGRVFDAAMETLGRIEAVYSKRRQG